MKKEDAHQAPSKEEAYALTRLDVFDGACGWIRDLFKQVCQGVPSEVLYGRAGFLSCVLFMAAHAGLALRDVGDIVAGAVQLILQDGRALAAVDAASHAGGAGSAGMFPLMWQWHDKRYLGAAHGLCGILTILLHLRSLVVGLGCDQHVQATIDAVLHARFPSGNLPSSLGSTDDRLVHWCHGAPGLVPMLCAAAAAYPDRRDEYLAAAAKAAEVISERGLLKKGVGICHGIGGNGLALLSLHRAVKRPGGDDTWRTLATRFALFACKPACSEPERVKQQLLATPDRPHSLFEGAAGLACLFAAVLEAGTFCQSSDAPNRHAAAGCAWLM